MISKEEFLSYISQNVIPELKKDDIERHQTFLQTVIIVLVGISLAFGLFCLALLTTEKNDSLFFNGYTFFAMGILYGTFLFAKGKAAYFRETIKGKINDKVFYPLKLTATAPTEYVSLKYLSDIHFFYQFDEKEIEDSFISQTLPYFSVHELKLIRGEKGDGVTVFKGPVLYHRPLKRYPTPIMIFKRGSLAGFDIFECNKIDWQEVTLEDPAFNRDYRIFAEDQVKARVILNPRFMEKLKDIKNTYNTHFRILFLDNYFIIAIRMRRNMFEFYNVFQQPSLKKFGKFYDEIKVLTDLIETLEFK